MRRGASGLHGFQREAKLRPQRQTESHPPMPDIQRFAIDGPVLIRPQVHGDARGYFFEAFRQDWFEREVATGVTFVQDNQSLSRQAGTVRGLHFQLAPRAQAKLVRVLRGAILDVAVDIRPGSPSFGRHVAVILSAEEKNQLYVPPGFAHGFCTLEADSEIHYKTTDYYSPEHDRGLAWDDPALGIDWPVAPDDAVLSERDRHHPCLAELAP